MTKKEISILFILLSLFFCKSTYHELKYEMMKATEKKDYDSYTNLYNKLIVTENNESIKPRTYEFEKKFKTYSIDRDLLGELIISNKQLEFKLYLDELEKKDKDEYLLNIYGLIQDILTKFGIDEKTDSFLHLILNRNINPNLAYSGKSPIELASAIHDINALKIFKKYSKKLDISVDIYGNKSVNNAIFYAASNASDHDLKDRRETVMFLLENGVNKNQRDERGNTILWRSVTGCDLKLLKYLVNKGINPKTKNNEGENIYTTSWNSLTTIEMRFVGTDQYERNFKFEYPRRCSEVANYFKSIY